MRRRERALARGQRRLERLEPRLVLASDFGDLPDEGFREAVRDYQTLLATDGPRHVIDATQSSLYLGARVDSEADATPNAQANGDDTSALPDDEDGIVEPSQDLVFTVGTSPTVRVRATNTTGQAATLYGWIDIDDNGMLDNTTERGSISVPGATSNGLFTLTFPRIPLDVPWAGITHIRLRLSADSAAANPNGSASGGEVEDYTGKIIRRSEGTVNDTKTIKIASGLNGGPVLADGAVFGTAVASLGDLDGDGITDLVVGADHDGTGGTYQGGSVHVLLMNRNGTAKATLPIASNVNGGAALANKDYFGVSAASLGDLDGDGVVDIAVGAIGDSTGGAEYSFRGAVHVLFLNQNGTVKSDVKLASGINGSPTLVDRDFFGRSVTSIGDLDGDGVADLAVGAFGDDTNGTDRGAVYVLMMNSNGTVKSHSKIASNTHGGPELVNVDQFGTSVESLGDLNGDGVTDLVVGADRDDTGGDYRGAAHVLLLNSNGTVKNSTKIASGINGGPTFEDFDQVGWSATPLGDLNGDGVTDLAIGAFRNGSDAGAIHVLTLNSNGTVKGHLTVGSNTNGGPTNADDRFSGSLASLGDLDGDGITDLAVGAYGDDTDGTDRGAAYILFLKSLHEDETALSITLTGSDSVRVSRVQEYLEVRINDVVDDQYTIPVATIQKLAIQGGSGSNFIDLSGIPFPSFPRLYLSATVSGGDGDDSIIGSPYSDYLYGDAGNDTITGGQGSDTIFGGTGSADMLIEFVAAELDWVPLLKLDGVVETDIYEIEQGTFFCSDNNNFVRLTEAGIPTTVYGGGGDDVIIGSGEGDSLDGQGGNDTLTGGQGDDTINGGVGTDLLRDQAYFDYIGPPLGPIRTVTLTNSSVTVKEGATTLHSEPLLGIERADLTAGPMRDILTATGFTGVGVTTLSGSGGHDSITGTPGPDLITTLAGRDSINGGGGSDTIFSGSGMDTINGGDGNDNLSGQNDNDVVFGGAGADVITGGAGIDSLYGESGNDFLSGQAGDGLLFGGDGNDTLQGNLANDTLNGEVGDDRLFGLQGNDVINGGDGADSLMGAIGNDSLDGGTGADTLQGDVGNDTINGGADFDRINEVLDTNITITGITVSSTGLGSDVVTTVERIQILGGPSNNFFDARQATLPVLLSGGAGSDTLLGGSKADGIIGSDGDDVLSGGAGADIIDGGNGTDYWLEKADTNFTVNGVVITSSVTGSETPVSIERIALIGGVGSNKLDATLATVPVVLIGGRGNDTLLGGAGPDTLSGGNRNDSTVAGGDGIDSLDGGAGTDVLEDDSGDIKVLGAGDTIAADIFTLLPSWIDAL